MEDKGLMRRQAGPRNFASFALAAVIALSLSFLATAAARPFIAGRTMDVQRESARFAAKRQPSIFYAGGGEKKQRIDFAAFGVPDSDSNKKEAVSEDKGPAGDIRNFKLVGTLPSVGAWVESGKSASLVLKGEHLDGYRLEDVMPEYAVFERDGEKFPVYLVYRT
jgi:hypothetical protein